MPIAIEDLLPQAYYWARRADDDLLQIIQISTVFGTEAEFLTVARMGTDVHSDLREFVFIEIVQGLTEDARLSA